MEQWKADVIKAGSEPIQSRGAHPYGFQVMSNLMRVGDYDDKFLRNYGNALVVAEDKITHGGSHPPGRAWYQPQQAHLNWMGGGAGQDPMSGFMEALGHNPKASTEFFKSDIDLTPENDKDDKKLNAFDYFSKDRDWPEELTDKGDLSKEPGYDSLGHALESATTGHAYDASWKARRTYVPSRTPRSCRRLSSATAAIRSTCTSNLASTTASARWAAHTSTSSTAHLSKRTRHP